MNRAKIILLVVVLFAAYSCNKTEEPLILIYDETGILLELEFVNQHVNQNKNLFTKDLSINIHSPDNVSIFGGYDSVYFRSYYPEGVYRVEVRLVFPITKKMDYTLKVMSSTSKKTYTVISSSFAPSDTGNLLQYVADVNKDGNIYKITEKLN